MTNTNILSIEGMTAKKEGSTNTELYIKLITLDSFVEDLDLYIEGIYHFTESNIGTLEAIHDAGVELSKKFSEVSAKETAVDLPSSDLQVLYSQAIYSMSATSYWLSRFANDPLSEDDGSANELLLFPLIESVDTVRKIEQLMDGIKDVKFVEDDTN
ncbi:hypothetical protein ACE1TF_11950 [Geomicrobium sp. JSM 1781026]|uniref:hypothetical protein n=1 Tax=Geomicrobium sp. JSM 1781026 TaxID=3344580 RepID=UPI0035C22787